MIIIITAYNDAGHVNKTYPGRHSITPVRDIKKVSCSYNSPRAEVRIISS